MIIFFESPEIVDLHGIQQIIKTQFKDHIAYDIYKKLHRKPYDHLDPDEYNKTALNYINIIIDIAKACPDKTYVVYNGILYLAVKATIEGDKRILNSIHNMVSSIPFSDIHTVFVTKKVDANECDMDRLEQFITELRTYNKCMENYDMYLNDTVKNNTYTTFIIEEGKDLNSSRLGTILNTIKHFKSDAVLSDK